MGIRSASATFSRFYLPDPVTEDFWGYVDERLRAGSFKECEDDQEQAAGFASWDDFFDPSFAYSSYHKGDYAAFHFRFDQRKVPGIILKQFVRQALQKYRDEHEGHWPSREERLEIRDNVQKWLLNRSLPQPAACEVVWNPSAKWLLLGTASSKMLESLLEHFEHHFRLYPVPLYHVQWALNLIPLDARQKDILNSMVSVKSSQAMEEGRFLGYEFLTWLWFFSEQYGGRLQLDENKELEVQMGEHLTLSLPGEGRERVICSTQANALHEARTALQQGKLVAEAQIFLQIGENDYFLKLDSFLWGIKGLKTPKQMAESDEEDADGRFLEKMFFLEEVFSALDALYTRFLTERLGPGWESDSLPLMKQWIEGREPEPRASAPF